MGAHYRMKQILHGASFIIFLSTSGVTGPTWSTRSFP
jgi:tryptophan synthase alpha subunit